MRNLLMLVCGAALLLAGDGNGIRPRGASSDYPAHETARGVTIAAAVIPPEQVKKLFSTDLIRAGYTVVEVAVYPDSGKDVDLSAADFMLSIGANSDALRPVSGATIASILQKKNTPQSRRASDITLYPTATIGYESGGYDPATGRRRNGVYTSTGVGVGIGDPGPAGPPPPASTDRDRQTMQQELQDKALPEGKTARTVAGYLYFPKPSGKARNALYELTFYGADGKIRVAVPPPSDK